MIRRILPLALLLVARVTAAQGIVGVVTDSATNEPLPCVDVTLQDSVGHVLQRALTAADGSFRLEAPAGPRSLEFAVWHRLPVKREMLSGDGAGLPLHYALTFEPAPALPPIFWPDTADSPPGRPLEMRPMRNLGQLVQRGEPAMAVVRYVVDSTGKVDRASIRVLESSHKDWERSVVGYLRDVRYEPARRNGQPVCALEYGTPFNFNAHP